MSDENREALYLILDCLRMIAQNSSVNNMTSRNLAVCLVPSLTHTIFSDSESLALSSVSMSRASYQKNDSALRGVHLTSLVDSNSNMACTLAYLIDNFDEVFKAPKDLLDRCGVSPYQNVIPMRLEMLGQNENEPFGNYETLMDHNLDELYEENKTKFRSWRTEYILNGIPLSSRKIKDSYPLYAYRGYIELPNVTASEIFRCYLTKGCLWSGNAERFVLRHLSTKNDIFYQRYSTHNSVFFDRDFTLLRQWRNIDDIYLLACTSIDISKNDLDPLYQSQQVQKVFSTDTHQRGLILGSRLIVEQLQGKSRINLILRLDLKGKDPSTYKLITPYIVTQELISLKEYYNTSQNKNTMIEFVV
ncbi:Rho GTPase-activating protein 7 [Thelohanellus kitauei]|uniref:Rho GTPase-activating protein 7 n=1 Tax=Thelohanellus kitauei TaxID=669202 RepID=A0A0C2MTA7_THEKT|nr:Rho GTPase-activating protein 7 [Thelohanellus kitauei]